MADAAGGSGEGAESGSRPGIGCVGASPGGVQALQTMFEALPDQSGAAFVVIVHLDPNRRSELQHVLSARTRMTVMQVEERARLEANHFYVIPPDRQLELADGEFLTGPSAEPPVKPKPIDLF